MISILIEGLIFGIMVLGVFMSYRVLNFCDMTVDGAFPMGACIFGACFVAGINPYLALLLAFIGGMLAGLCTTLIYTKLKIPDLLSGILMMTILYSISLRIAGKANISFHNVKKIITVSDPVNGISTISQELRTPFQQISDFFAAKFPALPSELGILIVLLIFVILLKFFMDLFYHTDLGLTMGALGDNQQMIISQGVNPQIVRGIGICIGDGLAAIAGAFFAMYSGFADVGSGTGVIVSGLASLMLGEFIIHSNKISLQTLRVLIGSIIYRGLMYLARSYGFLIHLKADDLKLITGVLIIICLIISKAGKKKNER